MQIIKGGISMKKTKRIVAVLSSIMLMASCSVSAVYADEIITEPTDSVNESMTDEKTTNLEELEEIESLIKSFIEEENLPSGVGIDVWHDIEGNEFSVLSVVAYPWDADKIENFMAENNIDNTKVAFFIRMVGRVENMAPSITGDVNGNGNVDVRDCSFIAITIAQGRNDELSESADYNGDNKVNVRDAAAIAQYLAVK